MAEPTVVKPDLDFVREVKELGGESLKKCFQCATCSVVCKLSPEENPFPRKEMIWAQWGLKDKLMKDPDVWMCYNCNDCSVHCPREAKPGEVLAAVRNYSFKDYAFPKFMGKALSQAKYLPLLFGFPIILLLLVLWGSDLPDGPILFREFLPYIYIDAAAAIFTVLVLTAIIVGVRRFWANLKEGSVGVQGGSASTAKSVTSSIVPVLIRVLKQEKFSDCEANNIRYYGHLGILYGFILCFITTSIVAGFIWGAELFFHQWEEFLLPPWSLFSVIKLLGNAGGLAIIAGCVIVLYNRYANKDKAGQFTYQDALFTWVVLLVAITGMVTQFGRMVDIALVAYLVYSIHLVLVFFLLAYLPYSKFMHMIFRFTALVYAESIGRTGKEIS
jgi:quinone-modifying oxidoreductase subunit QmoC